MRRSAEHGLRIAALLVSWSATAAVRAHPGPAEAPDFGQPACITVVDKRATPVLSIAYLIAFDDVMPEPDHIQLDDSKTHQFFAFRGEVRPDPPDYLFATFAGSAADPQPLPLWIDRDDVARSADANTSLIAPDFQPEAIGGDVLLERSDLVDRWLPIASNTRVPITEQQALSGVRWSLDAVPAGVYQVVGYVFSPPYNAWEPRPGVIKVTDGQRDVPALTVDSIDASLFGGQGRRVTGCVDAPAGSELRASYRVGSDPAAPWQPWATKPVAANGKFELCYRSPEPFVSDLVQVRVQAVAPNGDLAVAYAPDQLVLVANPAPCVASAKLCCEDAHAVPSAGTGAPAATGAAGGAPSEPAVGAAGPLPDAAAVAGSNSTPLPAVPGMSRSSGCALSRPGAASGQELGWYLLGLGLIARGRSTRQRAPVARTCADS